MDFRVARFVSGLFHPLLLPLATLMLMFFTDPLLRAMPGAFGYLATVLAVNTVAPALSLVMLHRRKRISDLDVSRREERAGPFGVVLLYYLLTFGVVYDASGGRMPAVYLAFLLGLVAVLGVAWLITFRFKISMHATAASGVAGTLYAVQFVHQEPRPLLVCAALLCAGLVGWSRVRLGRHRPEEVYAGGILGFVGMAAAVVVGTGWL